MFQDSNRYLWSGGYGGLSRFDGKQFVNYNRKNGLIDHNVNAISGDANHRVFVGTNKGLSILDKGRFTNYDYFPGYDNPFVTAFCKGYHHTLYVGTRRGLFMFKNEQIKAVGKLKNYNINCLLNPDTTAIFVGTDKGLVIYGHNTFKVLSKLNGLASNNVISLAKFKNKLIIGTSSGLSTYDLASERIDSYYIENGLIDENISTLVNQNDQFLWIGSPSGLLQYDGKHFSYYNIGSDNNSNQVRSSIKDSEGNLWFGTHSGLYRYRDNSFSSFDKVPGLSTSLIFQIFRDKQKNLWICTQNNGVFRQSQNFFRRYGVTEGLAENTSHAAIEDKEGRLIFGSNDGIYQLVNDRFVKVHLGDKYRGTCEVLFIDSKNVLWIGGNKCFVSLEWRNGKAVVHQYELNVAGDAVVYGFAEDGNGRLYIGTMLGGLFKMESGVIVNLTTQLKLNEETFFTLKYIDGKLFAASLNGLLILDVNTGKLDRISDSDGLNSELVYSIEFSRNKKWMWIGTNQGVNRLNLSKYLAEKKIEVTSYGRQEGFIGVECNNNGIWEDDDGSIWFGTVSGVNKHQPFEFRENKIPNKTLIQSIKLLNEDTLIQDSAVLPSSFNVISFYYRGICLTNPDKVVYQRKLAGLDKDWSSPSNEDFIKYTNLAPGSYTFMVRSSNNEGIWNNDHTSFKFKIRSPFYLTWWFVLGTFILVFGIIYFVFMLRIYNIKKKQKAEYERRVEMSKIELKALRSQMNPHFIFNSLNAIQHYIFNTKSDEAIKYLNKFARLVRIILNNSERPTVTVEDDLEALKLYLELEQMRFEEKFSYEIIIDDTVDVDYDIMPPLLMQPYVENAILHGLNPKPEKGKLEIRLRSENNFLICTITDNGIGREKASEIRRTMPVKKHKSLGMKITEDRLKILNEINNSQLSVTITDLKTPSGMALGTKVELFVPLNG